MVRLIKSFVDRRHYVIVRKIYIWFNKRISYLEIDFFFFLPNTDQKRKEKKILKRKW